MLFKGRLAAAVTSTLTIINNNIIQQQACVELQGVFIEDGINWDTQIDKLCIKLSCSAGIIKRLPCKLPLCASRLLYFCLVYPYL